MNVFSNIPMFLWSVATDCKIQINPYIKIILLVKRIININTQNYSFAICEI